MYSKCGFVHKKQKIIQLVLIDLSAAFDTVDHSILLDIMNKAFGVSDVALQWTHSYLRPRSQSIVIDHKVSKRFILEHGVPQGSCLGPVMFTQYSSPVFDVISCHEKQGHGYADDHQIYSSCSAGSLDIARASMEICIGEIRKWMLSMKLNKMNDTKTEYIIIGTRQQLAKCDNSSITIGDSTIQAADCIRNLGAHFDKHMSMEQHVKIKCRDAYAQLYNIGKIRKYLDFNSAERLINALVHSHLDYCNALLVGLSKKTAKQGANGAK